MLAGGICAPRADRRHYRSIELPNGLRTILASQLDADQAAAAVCVRCGSFQDPATRPGLSHLLEHMLFLGSEKYPLEGGFFAFLHERDGCANGCTGPEQTTYNFRVQADCLMEALDQFASMLIQPALDPSSIQREVRAVDSESTNHAIDDRCRAIQVLKAMAVDGHPFRRFNVGDLRSLGGDPGELHNQLRAYHKQHYKAGAMQLVVIGREDLDRLQAMVEACFCGVPRGTGPTQSYGVPLLPTGGHMVSFAPLADMRMLALYWLFPPLVMHQAAIAARYVEHVLNQEGAGSLHHALTVRGWAGSITAEVAHRLCDGQEFVLEVTLTCEGDRNRDGVLSMIFEHLSSIRRIGPRQTVFFELARLCEVDFQHGEGPSSPDKFVAAAAEAMTHFPASQALCGPIVFREWDPVAVAAQLDLLTPDRCLVLHASPAHTTEAAQPWARGWRVEPWYGAAFRAKQLPELWPKFHRRCAREVEGSLHGEVASSSHNFRGAEMDALGFLSPVAVSGSALLVTDFSLRCEALGLLPELRCPAARSPPQLLRSGGTVVRRVWHKLDSTFKTPRGSVSACVAVPAAALDPCASVALKLFVRLLEDDLRTSVGGALRAGLSYACEVDETYRTFTLTFSGFSERLLGFAGQVARRFRELLLELELMARSEEQAAMVRADRCVGSGHARAKAGAQGSVSGVGCFGRAGGWLDQELCCARDRLQGHRQILLAECQKLHSEAPEVLCEYYSCQLLRREAQHFSDYATILEKHVSLRSVVCDMRRALAQCQAEVLVHGNLTAGEALAAADLIGMALSGSSPIPEGVELPRPKVTALLAGSETIMELDIGVEFPALENSGTENMYIFGPLGEDLCRDACLAIICRAAGHSVYQTLRTEEQLGYVAQAEFWELRGVAGLRVLVQGARLSPAEVDKRIEAWLVRLRAEIDEMSDETFELHRRSAMGRWTRGDWVLSQEAERLWVEIRARRYAFGRASQAVVALEGVDRVDVLEVFDRRLAAGALERRKLSTRVLGTPAIESRFHLGVGANRLRKTRSNLLRSLEELRAFREQQEVFPDSAAWPLPVVSAE